MSTVVIKAEHLSKYYRLGVINHGMLYKDIQSWIARKRGKEDPHGQIGQDHFADRAEGFWALKDLNFEIHQGDRVGIIGKNGAGKSTLLKILSRVTAPTEGQVKIRGRVASLLEVGTGFHGELTGRENIFLNGAILGMKRREISQKLDEIIDFSEIGQYIDTPVKRYSSGMYVRLAFAVAAHLDSEILLADEVLAVGDAAFQKKAIGKMSDLSTGQGRTVLFVSHNMGAVSSLCAGGMLLERGVLVQFGSVDECIGSYLSQNIGSGSSTIWDGYDGDDELRMRHVELKSKTGHTGKYVRGEKLDLVMEYEILKKRYDFVFCVEIHNRHGIKLCEISALEQAGISADDLMKPGRHRLVLEMDTKLLAEGSYLVKFDFSIRNVRSIVSENVCLPIELFNKESESAFFIPWRNNIVSPLWKWEHRYFE